MIHAQEFLLRGKVLVFGLSGIHRIIKHVPPPLFIPLSLLPTLPVDLLITFNFYQLYTSTNILAKLKKRSLSVDDADFARWQKDLGSIIGWLVVMTRISDDGPGDVWC